MGAKWVLGLWYEMWDRTSRQGLDAGYGLRWVYERFWELPVLVVLVALWVVGGALLVGLCALAFYLLLGLL